MGIFGNAFGWPHLLLILAVILLLFGAAKLPALARSIGQSTRIFRGEMKAMRSDDTKPDAADAAPAPVSEPTVNREAPASSGGTAEPKS
jgi:sec-independent protein translocase protein TatA